MKLLSIILLSAITLESFGQRIVQSDTWFDLNKGQYQLRSLNSEFRNNSQIIQPQTKIKSLGNRTNYLIPDNRGVVLFKNNNPKSIEDVAGVLKENSLIEVNEIEYRKTFQNPDTTWKFTHEVWYSILINNELYYTDFKIHNLTFSRILESLKQTIVIASQDTGYDNYYDNGYPENFHILAFEQTSNGMNSIYDSEQLEFHCNCEFWVPEFETYEWKELEDGSLFIKLFGLEQTFSATWNGNMLIEVKTTGNKK